MKHLFIILTAVFATVPAIAQNVEKRGSSERVTFITDGVDSIPTNVSQVMSVPPQFYGGMGAMDKFIIDNLRYPAEAWNDTTYKKKDVFGCYCVIRKDGRAVFPRPTNMHTALSKEIARVVSLMPSWKPAEKDGKVIDVVFSISTSVLDPFFHIPYSGMPYVREMLAVSGSMDEGKYGISRAQADSIASYIFSVHEKGWNEMESTLTGARLLASLGRYDDAAAMLSRELTRYHQLGFTRKGKLGKLYPEESCYNPKTELHAAMTLAAVYDMAGMRENAREAYDNAIWLSGTMAEQGIRANNTFIQRSQHYNDLMREKTAIVRSERNSSVRLNPSDRYDVEYGPTYNDASREIDKRVAEGKISNARVIQINRQTEDITFDRSNRKSLRDAFRLYKIRAMLIGLRDGTEAEQAFVKDVSDGKAGKKMARHFRKWSKDLSLPVASHRELLENIVYYAPLNETGTETETARSAAKKFYDMRHRIEDVYPLGWLCK